jgi:hypothetical protein
LLAAVACCCLLLLLQLVHAVAAAARSCSCCCTLAAVWCDPLSSAASQCPAGAASSHWKHITSHALSAEYRLSAILGLPGLGQRNRLNIKSVPRCALLRRSTEIQQLPSAL